MFWRPTKSCDVSGCLQTSGEHIEPLIAAAGFRWFEIDGEVDGREYVGDVLLCPKHIEEMETFIRRHDAGEDVRGLLFSSFRGGEAREPVWA